jgi:hypothetical protein
MSRTSPSRQSLPAVWRGRRCYRWTEEVGNFSKNFLNNPRFFLTRISCKIYFGLMVKEHTYTPIGILQIFSTSVFAGPYWRPDLNGDGFVNFSDFGGFAEKWGQSGYSLEGDLDENGTVNVSDLAEFAEKWLEYFKIIYVDANAELGGDGNSWSNAFIYFQDALADANAGCRIYVAQGIYKPDANSSNPDGTQLRASTFQLPEGVAVYGGFPAGGGSWDNRDWVNNETILSGDIGVADVNNDNCYNVVMGANDVTIDGLTIADGNADGRFCFWTSAGAGMYNEGDNVMIANCVFRDNFAIFRGGGIYNGGVWNPGSIKTLTNCTFVENETGGNGGGICNAGDIKTLTKCAFIENEAGVEGGGICNAGTIEKISSCSFNGNMVVLYGGAISSPYLGDIQTVINSVFSTNTAGYGGGIYHHWPGPSITIINCTFSANRGYTYGGGGIFGGNVSVSNSVVWGTEESQEDQIDGYNVTVNSSCIQYCASEFLGVGNTFEDPCFIDPNNPAGPDGIFCTADDGLRLSSSSSPCANTGDNNFVPVETITDIKGHARFHGAAVDMGAYEFGDLDINQDTDGDGMVDWWEYKFGLNPNDANDANEDLDEDGLTNIGEYRAGTDVTNPDTDGDGMQDGWEVQHNLNPLVNDGSGDPDGDGLVNLGEYYRSTNPHNPDTDSDGLSDGYEVSIGTNPANLDTDGDGFSDSWEVQYGFDPTNPNDPCLDADGDGISNVLERTIGTDQLNADTDGDGLPDGWEVTNNFNPLVKDNVTQDADGDGLSLAAEFAFSCNPFATDTDGDGVSDAVEAAQGSLPNDASDGGQAPSADQICELRLTIGDPSPEIVTDAYALTVGPVNCYAPYHEPIKSVIYSQFRLGQRYPISIVWMGNDEGGMDYDYYAIIGAVSLPAGVVMQIDDPDGILGDHFISGDTPIFYAANKTAYVNLIKANLKIYNGGNNNMSGSEVPEADEESVGAYLLVNCDDDDGDNIPDLYESGSGYQDDDLARLDLSGIPAGSNEGTLELIKTSGSIKLWQNQNKTAEQTILSWDLSTSSPPTTLWIEGIGRSTIERDIELELRYTNGSDTSLDRVRLTVVMVNLGNIVCRAMDLFGIGSIEVGHSGVVVNYTGACTPGDLSNSQNFGVIEMAGPTEKTLTTFTDFPSLPSFGCYAWGLEYADRLRIVKTAKALRDRVVNYTFAKVLLPSNWDDTIAGIDYLRCDGLAEVCYEINGKMVWGKIVDGSVHYDIRVDSYQEEHNEIVLMFELWKQHLAPATQCGYGNFESYRGTYWQTTLYPLNLCQPIGHTGGN